MALISLGGTGVFVILGLLLGVLIAYERVAFEPGTLPFVALIRTIRPLLLPLVGVLAVGTVKLSPLLQLLISAALLLVAWRLILNPERLRFKATLRWQGPIVCKLVKQFAVILIVGVPAALLLEGAFTDTRHFESIGGLATTILVLALGVWLIAFLLRLLSYATSWLRAAVALAFALAGVRQAMAAGFLPGDSHVSGASPTLFIAIAVGLLLFESLLDLIAAKREREPESTAKAWKVIDPVLWVRDGVLPAGLPLAAERWGFTTALAATAILLASAIYGLIDTEQPGAEVVAPNGERIHPELPRTPPGEKHELALVKEYAPVLALTREERWSPVTANSYFDPPEGTEPVTLSGPPGTESKPIASLDQLERRCPDLAASPCYTLDIHCPSGEGRCAGGQARPSRPNDRLYREGAVYYRVLRKDEGKARGKIGSRPPDVFVDKGPYRENLSMLIQYWYFYRYDEWESSLFAGQLVQRHEGDWEAVTVGLSEKEPLFVAYSAHCAGTWRRWREVEVSGKLPRPWTHPLVAVAEGSHANYPKADQKRSPDWASCARKLPAGTSTAIGYASNIRDKTEYGWLWFPAARGWREANTEVPPMSFPGTWGASDTTTLENFKSNRLANGPGPRTPTQQALWEKPIELIFCGRYTGPREYDGCEGE